LICSLDVRTLLSIAGLAQELNVPFRVAAASWDWNDMIVLKLLWAATLDALPLVALPHKQTYLVWNALPSRNIGTFKPVERL
jgi:hypothetical protein